MIPELDFPKKNQAKMFYIRNKQGEYLRVNRDGQAFWVNEAKATSFQYRYKQDADRVLHDNGIRSEDVVFDLDIESGWAF